jgi:hypothetical protein
MKRLIIIFLLLACGQPSVSHDGKLPIIDVHIHSRTKADRNEKGEILARPCLTAGQKRNIFYNNAARLLRLRVE